MTVTKQVSVSSCVCCAGSCEHGNETHIPQKVGNFLTSLVTSSFSRTLLHELLSLLVIV